MYQPDVAYAPHWHEWLKVYFAVYEFDNILYAMYPHPISRWYSTGNAENTMPEDMILQMVVYAPTHLVIHNNFLLDHQMNFTGYTGTKSASIKENGLSTKQMERMFSGADKVDILNNGETIKVTYFHKNYKKLNYSIFL